MKVKNEKSKYRQRGYYCSQCNVTSCVYGNDDGPTTVCCDGAPMAKIWDHLVDETVICTPYEEPAK